VRAVPRRVAGAPAALDAFGRRPVGRLVLPGLLMAVLLAAAGAAGALAVPRLATTPLPGAAPADAAAPVESADPGLEPPDLSASAAPLPSPSAGAAAGPAGMRPWAAPLAAKLGIPVEALQAYGYAESTLAVTKPGCQLRWTTLAGIGKIESSHGRANASLGPDGKSLPPIVGAPLDGTGGRQRIPDSDGGQLDGDRTWDRAVGPMQFIPGTWKGYAADADGDGVADPNDIDDAALAAANYLCAGGRNLGTPTGWWPAILSYNDVQVYAQDVFLAAHDYGVRSRG
jgi:hypothetical protein